MLKEKLGTIHWELVERYSQAKLVEFPYGQTAEEYWKRHIDDLMAEVEFYDYEIELHTKFVDRAKVTTKEAFGHLEELEPKGRTAFLFDKRISRRW